MFSIYIKASLWCEITCRWRKQLHKLWKERKQFFGCKFSLYPGSTFIYVPDKICLEHVNGWNSTIAAYKHYNVIVIPTSFQILRLPRCRWFGSRWRSPISSIHLRLQCRSRRPGYLGKYIYIYHHIETKQNIYIYGCEFNSMKVPDGAKRSKVHHASSSQSASPEADTVPAVPWLLVPSFVIGICSQWTTF